ncbi:MAG: hypothetical protein L0287_33065 [Anaerolineae bacterium]|nr:hypothetical protein [Anaerolineae bacterium]
MTLAELIKAVDELSHEELRQLREYIEQQERKPAELDIDALEQVFAELREGFSKKDLEELEWAMNVEYIEAVDDTEWKA